MLDAIGHPVAQLRRIAIGPIRDTRLKVGRWRDLTEAEVKSLKKLSSRAESSAPPKASPHRTRRPRRP
jgi:23S rRNA pseudouridine2605 synthase